MSRTFVAGLVASTSLLAISGTAFAQTGAAGDQRPGTPAASPVGPAGAQASTTGASGDQDGTGANGTRDDIVVTGSRIVQNGNSMPTPVTVISTDALLATRPGNLAEVLNDLPIFAGSRTQASNTGSNGAAGSPSTSANAYNGINLRNLGVIRTLILFDGHRAPPSTPEGFVDVNTIPQALLKRVDVVTGGASAVYGSDAITGVVNFITDNNFNGVKANAQYGISKYGDAKSYEGGIAAGMGFLDGRVHIEGSFNYRHDDGLDSKFDRPWGYEVRTLQGSGTAANPYFQVIGARINNTTFGGRINNGVLADQRFTTGGVLVPFVHGSKTGQGGVIPNGLPYEIGGDGATDNGQLRATLELKQSFSRLDLDVTDDIHFYVTSSFSANKSLGTGGYYSTATLTVSRDNAFLPAAYKTALTNANQPTFTFGKTFSGLPRGLLETNAKQLMINTGLNGKIGGFNWELGYLRSRSGFAVAQDEARDQGRFAAALDSVLVNGTAVCRASLTNAAYANCVPVNVFGPNSESQASIDYFMRRVNYKTFLGMDDFSGSISGSPFDTWAGPLSVAISGEYRHTTEQVDSGFLPTAFANCAGVLYNCTATTAATSTSVAKLPKSGVRVAEAAIEAQVPLLRDVFVAKSLDLNLAFRHAHYDISAGNANTWKIGLVWQPAESVTVRATRSRDFRAPTIDELFRPIALTTNSAAFPDYITGSPVTTANVTIHNGGNPNLQPEISDTLTYGVVLKPTNNFSVAVDAFHIKIKNYIFLVQGNSPPEQGICYDSKGTSPYCQLITRGLGIYDRANPLAGAAGNAVTDWYQQPINIANETTYGADFEVNWRTELLGRPVGLRLLTTWQPELKFHRDGLVDNDYSGVAFGTNGIQATPEYRVTEFIDLKPTDSLTVNIQERWRSALKFHADPTVVVSSPPIKPLWLTSVNVAYDLPVGGAKIQAFFNVQNLFNAYPPRAGFWGNPTPGSFGEFTTSDDVIGRYYTFGLRGRF